MRLLDLNIIVVFSLAKVTFCVVDFVNEYTHGKIFVLKLCNSLLWALLSSLQLMRRYRGLSGHIGSRTHCSTAGSRVKPNRMGHMVAFPMIDSIPNIYTTNTTHCLDIF